MTGSPFPYQGPLDAEHVRGRSDLIADLAQRVTDRRVTALLGPRRFGKTSVIRRVVADLSGISYDAVWVDLYALTSLSDLAARLDQALDRVRGPWRETLGRVASAIELTLGTVAVSLQGRGRNRPDPAVAVAGLMRTLTTAAQGRQVVVVFDEFAGLSGVEGAAGLLRTSLQHHYRDIGLIVAGSEPSLVRTLFTDQAQPFYGQADLVEIPPLPRIEVIDIVAEGFRRTDRRAGVVAERIAAFTDGHPQRSMQLADAVWRATPDGSEATVETWSTGLDDVRRATAAGFERMYASLPGGQQKVLRAFATGGSIFGAAADLLDLSAGTATSARGALADLGHVHHRDGWQIVDPLLADWIVHRFPI